MFRLILILFFMSSSAVLAQTSPHDQAGALWRNGQAQAAIDLLLMHPNDPNALVQLSLIYRAKDRPDEAFDAAKRAADMRSAAGQYLLGEYYQKGTGTAQNLGKSGNLKRLAQRQGFDPVAAGLKQVETRTVDKGAQALADVKLMINQHRSSQNEIREKLEEAARLGSWEGENMLAHWLMRGTGGPKDTKRGMAILTKNYKVVQDAVAGDADAQYLLGTYYKDFTNGRRVFPENIDLAVTWYGRAAAQGHPDGLSDFGWAILAAASSNPIIIDTRDGDALSTAKGVLTLAVERGGRQAKGRLARVETLLKRKQKRDVYVKAAVGLLALMAHAAANAPDNPEPVQTFKRDNCAGMNGLGWVSTSAGNAAAIFGGCSRY